MKNLKNYVFGSFLALSLLLTSCNKDVDIAVDTELIAVNAQIDFGNELDLYYKVAGAGLWGALAFVFSIIISYIIQHILIS